MSRHVTVFDRQAIHTISDGVHIIARAQAGEEKYPYDRNLSSIEALFRLAREQGCDYLHLDQDGPLVEGLPVFDW